MEAGGLSQGSLARRDHRRSARVLALVAAISLMSLGDLYMTLVHLRGFGMIEMNPLARLVMQHHATWVLIAWKLASITLCAGILSIFRHRRSAELGAILCFAVLTALTLQWIRYSDQVSHNPSLMQAVAATTSDMPDFVRSSDLGN
jgi:hypothetical protein